MFSPTVSLPDGTYYQFTVYCDAGVPISGGVWGNLYGSVAEVETWPSLNKVTATVRNDSGITVQAQASAVCATS